MSILTLQFPEVRQKKEIRPKQCNYCKGKTFQRWREVRRPALAVDSCFDINGNMIASGDDVWDGILDEDPDGDCTMLFPICGTSRIGASGPIKKSFFKYQLMPVAEAVAQGLYGVWVPTPTQQAMLEQVFPDGV